MLIKDRRLRPREHVRGAFSREHQRMPIQVRINAESGGTQWTMEASDLSVGGAWLAEAGPTSVGAHVLLTLDGVEAQLVGEVVRLRHNGCAVKFQEISADARAQLAALLALTFGSVA
jgi:hypothetical protein